MLVSKEPLVFIDLNEGNSQKSGQPYKFVKLANPLTFENYNMSADVNKKFANFKAGDRVLIDVELKDRFGNTQVLVSDIYPAE